MIFSGELNKEGIVESSQIRENLHQRNNLGLLLFSPSFYVQSGPKVGIQ